MEGILEYLLFFSILALILAILIIVKDSRINYFFTLTITLVILFFIVNPELVITGAKKGAILFFNSVFPTLFPFLVCIEFLMAYDGISIYSKLFGKILCFPLNLPSKCSLPIIISFICGYPLGAKSSVTLYETGAIKENTLKRLLNIATNASPLFIVGSVATTMLHSPGLGLILLIANYLSILFMSFILPKSTDNETSYNVSSIPNNSYKKNFGEILKEALDNSLKTSLSVGSFIIIFSIILNLLNTNSLFNNFLKFICTSIPILDLNTLKGIILGSIEITNGCYLISLSSINPIIKYSIISFLCSFSGLSIICQVYSFTYKVKNTSIIKYSINKFIQGIISFIITYVVLTFVPMDLSTFSSFSLPINNFAIPSIVLLSLTLLSMAILYLKSLFHSS